MYAHEAQNDEQSHVHLDRQTLGQTIKQFENGEQCRYTLSYTCYLIRNIKLLYSNYLYIYIQV